MEPNDATLLEQLRTCGTERIAQCVLCRDSVTAQDDHWAGLLALPGEFGVVRCTSCGLRWLSPRPDQAGYNAIYSARHYFHSEEVEYRVHERLAHFADRVKELQARLGRPSISIMDYGAATGEFVRIARDLGAQVVGVELSADARAEALDKHGIDLVPPGEAQALGPFDVIHMNHVFEHVPDPVAHLRWCRDRLAVGGLLVIEVPHQFMGAMDRVRRLLKRGGRQERFDAFSLHHTYFFTPQNLEALCRREGFAVTRLRTIQPYLRDNMTWKPMLMFRATRLLARIYPAGDMIELLAERR